SSVEFVHRMTETAMHSPPNSPLSDASVETTNEFFPDAAVVPVHATVGSVLRFARRLEGDNGGRAYGFAMHARDRDITSANSQLHSHDEHLYLEDLELTVRAYDSLVHKFLGLR